MTAVALLVVAIVIAVVAAPGRARLAADDTYPDRVVRGADLVLTAVMVVLLASAAIVAAVGSALPAYDLIAGRVVAVIAAAVTGGPVVRTVLAVGGIPTRNDNYDDPAPDPPLRGGRVIGLLERTGVAVSLLLGWPAGIAVILGIKGLARFPQLREHHASEQFILGTFASVLWACAAAGIGVLLGR